MSDHKNRRFYFESTRSPNVFRVNLSDLNFSDGRPSRRLSISSGAMFAGNTATQFKETQPLPFLPADGK